MYSRVAQILPILLLPALSWAQFEKPGAPEPPDDPNLPRVLLIGDSISGGYGPVVIERLRGKANVHFIHRKIVNGDTNNGMAEIGAWLAAGPWDVIHFNWGLWDLKVQPDGRNFVPIEKYATNLRELVKTLKQTQAKLIFATITPVPEHVLFVSRRTEDVPIYNAVALKIMSEEQIPVDDLYAIALPRLPEIQWPNDVHFAPEGNEVLGHRAATAITYMLMSLKPKR